MPTLRRCLEDGHEIVSVWTQPDRPAGRGNKLKAPPVKEYAQLCGLPVHQPIKIRTPEAHTLFASYNADAAVVVAYGRILPPLLAPSRAGEHRTFSLLPKYRAQLVNWAMVRVKRDGRNTCRWTRGSRGGDSVTTQDIDCPETRRS